MEYFKRPIPKGFRIYSSFEVAGLHVGNRRSCLDEFVSGDNLDVCFEPEPTNVHDKNAVLIVGTYERKSLIGSLLGRADRKRVMLGYIPAQEAEALQVTGALACVIPRLNSASSSADSWTSLTVDALGPKGTPICEQFFDYLKRQRNTAPARQEDVTFLKLCGTIIKKGLTSGEASAQVTRLRAELAGQAVTKLAEVDALTGLVDSLLDEFSNAENADMYDLRKVPPGTVLTAVMELSARGASAAQIEDDFDLVAQKIRELRPSLARS